MTAMCYSDAIDLFSKLNSSMVQVDAFIERIDAMLTSDEEQIGKNGFFKRLDDENQKVNPAIRAVFEFMEYKRVLIRAIPIQGQIKDRLRPLVKITAELQPGDKTIATAYIFRERLGKTPHHEEEYNSATQRNEELGYAFTYDLIAGLGSAITHEQI